MAFGLGFPPSEVPMSPPLSVVSPTGRGNRALVCCNCGGCCSSSSPCPVGTEACSRKWGCGPRGSGGAAGKTLPGLFGGCGRGMRPPLLEAPPAPDSSAKPSPKSSSSSASLCRSARPSDGRAPAGAACPSSAAPLGGASRVGEANLRLANLDAETNSASRVLGRPGGGAAGGFGFRLVAALAWARNSARGSGTEPGCRRQISFMMWIARWHGNCHTSGNSVSNTTRPQAGSAPAPTAAPRGGTLSGCASAKRRAIRRTPSGVASGELFDASSSSKSQNFSQRSSSGKSCTRCSTCITTVGSHASTSNLDLQGLASGRRLSEMSHSTSRRTSSGVVSAAAACAALCTTAAEPARAAAPRVQGGGVPAASSVSRARSAAWRPSSESSRALKVSNVSRMSETHAA
mmetsp:Transcript_149323/g.479517  ORF Transcript_149323/g.479517 Transcript_149323/m.479517 type:complete len:403 (-) Transcript_149323:1058-2266(-)